MLPQFIIVSCLVVVLVTYVYLSRRVGNFINILTPLLLFEIPAHYILELAYILIFGRSGSDYAYLYCYATYTAGIVATAIGYLATPPRPAPIVLWAPSLAIPGLPWLFLGLGAALYAPVLLAYPDLLLSPRAIYALTRTGYGINFFLSSFAVYIGYILLVFSPDRRPFAHGIYFLSAVLLLYMHGSKGHVLQLFLIALYFQVFVRTRRFNFAKLIILGASATVGIVGLFYITSSPESRIDMLSSIVGYSDYTRNTMLVIDDPNLILQNGRLTAEQSLYSITPRAAFPNKPTDFGGLWLARQYFPERFAANTGAPGFGLGVIYADFGDFTILYWACASLLAGIVMKLLVARLEVAPDAGTFAFLLAFLNVQLIPAGAAVPLLFYYVCSVLIRVLSRPSAPVRSFPGKNPMRRFQKIGC